MKIFVDILNLLGKCGRNFSKPRFTNSKMSMKIFIDVEVKELMLNFDRDSFAIQNYTLSKTNHYLPACLRYVW